jgi:uncharacterized protein (DUF2141 family)
MLLAILATLPAMLGSGTGAASASTIQGPSSGSLTITITGLKSDAGRVRVAVFDAPERWLKDAAYARVLDIESRSCQWLIEDLPHGEYGIAVFHDQNDNGENDRNFLGIPREPYGFSNNVRVKFGPPKWEKAKFAVTASAAEIVVKVR